MAFELTQEQELFKETARDFADKEIATLASKIDSERRVPSDLLAKLSILGLLGVTVPSKYGGAGADFLSQIIVSEEVSRASGSLGLQVAFHNALVCDSILASKNENLKDTLLPKLVAGGCGAVDLFSLTAHDEHRDGVSCEISGEGITLNGNLENVLSASDASVFLIVAGVSGSKDNVAVAFSKDELTGEGFTVGESKKLLGMRASGFSNIAFHSLKLSSNNLLFGSAIQSAVEGTLLTRSRLALASVALGVAQAAIDASVKYANQRMQFNRKIGSFYAIQDMIATSETEVQTARSLTYLASSRMQDSDDESLARDSALAKISASLAAVNSARRAIRVHGGYGFMRDYPVERYARDARLTPIFLETNEELKSVLAASLLGY